MQVPRRHCQSVPVKRPKVVTKQVPREICVTSTGSGCGGGGGGGGGGYGHDCYGGGGSTPQGGYADHRKDEEVAEESIVKRQVEQEAVEAVQPWRRWRAEARSQGKEQQEVAPVKEVEVVTTKPFEDFIFVTEQQQQAEGAGFKAPFTAWMASRPGPAARRP